MSSDILPKHDCEFSQNNQTIEIFLLLATLKDSIWLLGIPCWVFGVSDRGLAAFADGYLSPTEILHLLTTSFFFMFWLFLKPDKNLQEDKMETEQHYPSDLNYYSNETHLHLCIAKDRMFELQEQHMIAQAYNLPFPYVCQIYHLLNLKHLETVHNFSLNNLKVIDVSHFEPTKNGGMLKFQTILALSFNVLRIWRQPIVEVELILHTPYTVELSIPVYNNKRIIVIFNVLPLTKGTHKLFIDIYSNLNWPKPFLQLVLHCASCLTLYEDLPYLRVLSQRNLDRLINLNKISNQETMWLFRRFVELYGSSLKPTNEVKLISGNEEK
jgi:hypothetical protein